MLRSSLRPRRLLGQFTEKEARSNTGEDWSEKVAADLVEIIGLPHANVDLALRHGVRGVAVVDFLENGHDLVHGNELMVSEAAWVPPPPYGWQIAPLSGTTSHVKLSWKEDVSSDTLKLYNVYRNQQLIATVTEPTYSDSTGLSCDTLGFCSAVYKVVAVSNTGASSAGAQLTCTWGTYISLTGTADFAG